MNLSRLLEAVTPLKMTGANGDRLEIGSIHYRAQEVQPGGLFVAIRGLAADGHDFINAALSRGALAIVTQKPVNYKEAVIIKVENTRKALAAISDRFYASPSEKLTMVAITGTNGKTTTAFLIERILQCAGTAVGVIGTLNFRYGGKTFSNPMTTPESTDLQRILADMLANGITHVAMEVSSHAIDLHRIDHCRFDVAVFTNLTRDHLDYHGDMESYWRCKKRLFTDILGSGPQKHRVAAVINHNNEKGRELLSLLSERPDQSTILSAGEADGSSIRCQQIEYGLTGMSGRISTPKGSFELKSSLVGRHNLENILCAAGVGIALDLSLADIKTGLEAVSSVPGRLERIPNDSERFVYVDYAHTPDALKNVLSALKRMATGRMICVFGCGGNRDRDKRPQMGAISGRLCDLSVVTTDNPRTEPPLEIIGQILQGTRKTVAHEYSGQDLATGFHQKGYVIEPDRKHAIRLALLASRPGDTVLIAGKGNETYQIIGADTFPFDDREQVREALSALALISDNKRQIDVKNNTLSMNYT
ncbi:MAG: UDP-N-acetylmuramoyl-L-alanyl-D-glutamate--2,6-diaminopimelate ligase [Desulfobacterales bacterium]|uniref:UDP-N-acetylmuramoyl-L-alanyl-D-glutamate--2,6-diaminopimelate ligase n=1 Tax=Candidatus Desulfatibia profunda TaxID=2841695 RepID=A0A8J6NKC4_9BACT|nr:UDP-N-acetylmuramoyl-L-alanyl-D-glutamate--2,6-diaminopimelate ligase [Candidatus Desulfatibia profunda]MBL7178708.1 UDP-N-acetylmuramoyl-L-alanyl-D-glutamate--2,6-diaminopimelate ligase [Desulfobacterales bacterium]